MPLKEEIVSLIDELDATAAKVGACNTILNSKGKLFGFNTDVEGFARPLRRRIGSFRSIRSVLIGAGGAARAAAIALAEGGCREVVILNRTVEKGRKLAEMLEGKYSINARASHLSQEELDRIVDPNLIINASPLDFRDAKIRFNRLRLNDGVVAYDMVYSHAERSFFLGELEKGGATTIPGNEMLIEQAAISFEIWTGIKPDLSQMSIDALSALEEMRRP